jgi:hypothetical protein
LHRGLVVRIDDLDRVQGVVESLDAGFVLIPERLGRLLQRDGPELLWARMLNLDQSLCLQHADRVVYPRPGDLSHLAELLRRPRA